MDALEKVCKEYIAQREELKKQIHAYIDGYIRQLVDEYIFEIMKQEVPSATGGIVGGVPSQSDIQRVLNMTDEEAYQNALDDPDNPPLSEEQIKKIEASLNAKRNIRDCLIALNRGEIPQPFIEHQEEVLRKYNYLYEKEKNKDNQHRGCRISDKDYQDFFLKNILCGEAQENTIARRVYKALKDNGINDTDIFNKTMKLHEEFNGWAELLFMKKEISVYNLLLSIQQHYLGLLHAYAMASQNLSEKLKTLDTTRNKGE